MPILCLNFKFDKRQLIGVKDQKNVFLIKMADIVY